MHPVACTPSYTQCGPSAVSFVARNKRTMEVSTMRLAVRLLAGALLLAVLLLPNTVSANATKAFPDLIALPNGWLPEGIVTGRGPVIYSGSRANGAIYAANLRTGQGEIIVPGQAGRVAVGLSFDVRTNYIFVAGGP